MNITLTRTRSLQVKFATRFVEPSLFLWLCLMTYSHCNGRDNVFVVLIYYTGRNYHIETQVVIYSVVFLFDLEPNYKVLQIFVKIPNMQFHGNQSDAFGTLSGRPNQDENK